MEPKIKHKNRISDPFHFIDDNGNKVPNNELWGRTTTFPMYYHGATRKKDGKTWWILHGNMHGSQINDTKITLNTTPSQRELIQLTDQEMKILEPSNNVRTAVMIQEGNKAWDLYQKKATEWDNKIDTYLKTHTSTKPHPTQPKETTIPNKLTNYNMLKLRDKINEIIQYLEDT